MACVTGLDCHRSAAYFHRTTCDLFNCGVATSSTRDLFINRGMYSTAALLHITSRGVAALLHRSACDITVRCTTHDCQCVHNIPIAIAFRLLHATKGHIALSPGPFPAFVPSFS